MKTIYVDMDDVLCETARQFLVVMQREFGKCVDYNQLTNFDLEQVCGLRPEEREKLYEIVHLPDELLGIAPMVEAIVILKDWASAGYEIAIVTGRPPDTYDVSLEWLMRHGVPYHSFTVVDKYGRFQTENTIGVTLAELTTQRFCWAVEDSLKMANFLASEMNLAVALLDRPWNRGPIQHPKIRRCADWQGIARAFPNGTSF
jgi:uncharacterized HAD superfamily protein